MTFGEMEGMIDLDENRLEGEGDGLTRAVEDPERIDLLYGRRKPLHGVRILITPRQRKVPKFRRLLVCRVGAWIFVLGVSIRGI